MQLRSPHVTSPAPRAVWQALLEASADAVPFQTPAWLDCICEVDGYQDASRLYETREHRQLVLPMVRRRRLLDGLTTEEALPPQWGYGGLVAPHRVHVDEVAAVFTDLVQRGILRTTLKPGPLAAEIWAAAAPSQIITVPHLVHVLRLDGGFEHVWKKRFSSTTRTAVRQAERAGLSVETDTSGALVPAFYDLYIRWLEHRARERRVPVPISRWLGKRNDPLRKFQLVAKSLGSACRTWVARLNGQPAAALIVLIQGANAIYWRGTSDKELAGPSRANNLLQKLAIEDACRAGCHYYHMGESGGVASLMKFKESFGAEAHQYVEYRLERLPLTSIDARLNGLMSQAMKIARPS